jgi:parallel beta-helix repeat protein
MHGLVRPAALAFTIAVLIGTLLAVPASGAVEVWVVDDNGAQCENADFASIAEAVEDARVTDGDIVRVCPGLYVGGVTIAKSITLRGDPDAIDAIDCFQLSLAIDPTIHAIVDPTDRTPSGASFGLKLRANGVTVSGLVFQDGYLGIDASDAFSGYRISHNVFRSHAYFGVELGSNGEAPSRADHNCFWENAVRVGEAGGGLGSELDDPFLDITLPANRTLANARDLANARIDHNRTFRNNEALTAFGPGLRDRAVFRENVMRDDRIGLLIQHSVSSAMVDNDVAVPEVWPVRSTPTGGAIITSPIAVGGDNDGLELVGNVVSGGRIGITFQLAGGFDVFPTSSHDMSVSANVVANAGRHGFGFAPPPTSGPAIGVPSVVDSTFQANSSSANGFHGFLLTAGSTGNDLLNNVADANGASGIYVTPNAGGNTFTDNSMHGNGWNPAVLPPLVTAPKVDARDDSWPGNKWTNTSCDTDSPVGEICGVP